MLPRKAFSETFVRDSCSGMNVLGGLATTWREDLDERFFSLVALVNYVRGDICAIIFSVGKLGYCISESSWGSVNLNFLMMNSFLAVT